MPNQPKTTDCHRALLAFDDDQIRTFGVVDHTHGGWFYVSFKHPNQTFDHYASNGETAKKLDFTCLREMSLQVFKWMVDLNFPTRNALRNASHFQQAAVAPLNENDIERILLWRHFQMTKGMAA